MGPQEAMHDIVFYDGHCALCHSTVKFVLKHERPGNAFHFAPLQGETFRTQVPQEQRQGLPDSIVLKTAGGSLLARSDAMIYILRRLGGGWKIQAAILEAVPRSVRNGIYDFIARIRYRVFGTRQNLCPLVPLDLRDRFDP
jgi:predicted DCC family thiol-disulfide oxidoreductase YuxK